MIIESIKLENKSNVDIMRLFKHIKAVLNRAKHLKLLKQCVETQPTIIYSNQIIIFGRQKNDTP